MPRVTALRAQSRARVAVELDGEPWRVIPTDAALLVGLVPGLDLDRARLRLLARELRRRRALAVAARAVRGRDLSAAALAQRLEDNCVAPVDRHDTLALLERAGIVDDERVARHRAQVLADRGLGDAVIREDLERRGFAREAAESALAELEPESERGVRVVATARDRRRAAELLARKGFAAETITDVLDLDVADTA